MIFGPLTSRLCALGVAACLGGCAASAAPAPAASPPASPPAASPAEHVDGAKAKALVQSGARLVDVRSPEEYGTKHIDGAQNMPVDTLSENALEPKTAPVVVYCASGRRSARAAAFLTAHGYTRVYDLGAMSSWGD